MINLAELITDPDFAQKFQIIRKAGSYLKGRYQTEEIRESVIGIVDPVNAKDLEFIPEADRMKSSKTFYSHSSLSLGNNDDTADICVYKGRRFKLVNVAEYEDYGYWRSIGVDMGSDSG